MLQQLSAFYRQYNPEHISKVPQLLQKFRGDEEALNRALKGRYGVSLQDTRAKSLIISASHPDKGVALALLQASDADTLFRLFEQHRIGFGHTNGMQMTRRLNRVCANRQSLDSAICAERLQVWVGFIHSCLKDWNVNQLTQVEAELNGLCLLDDKMQTKLDQCREAASLSNGSYTMWKERL